MSVQTNKKIVVVKYGSKCVVDDAGLDQARINDYAGKLTALRQTHDVIVVASGSVAAGKRYWLENGPNAHLADTRVLASIGSAGANEAWRQAFKKQGIFVGQVLITHREIEDDKEGGSLITMLKKLLAAGVVPIINENDVLSSQELKKLAYGGDNDGLAAHLGQSLSAETLMFLIDKEGYMEDDEARSQLSLKEIQGMQHMNWETNTEGTGSMSSKLAAASRAVGSGLKAFIANAETDDYRQIIEGRAGTEVVK